MMNPDDGLDIGGNNEEVADPQEGQEQEEPEEETSDDEPNQEDDEEQEEEASERDYEEDAKWATARRKAESKYKPVQDENKALKERLKALEAEKAKDQKNQEAVSKYTTMGYDESTAKILAAQDLKLQEIEQGRIRDKFERQAERLETKYPDVMENLDNLIEVCNKTGWSLDKVCRAEYGEMPERDKKVKTGMETLVKNKASQASKAKPVTVSQDKPAVTKLSAEDEKAYQYYAKHNPGVSRKQYDERVLKPRRERE